MMKRATVALIDESRCIGCTRCIDACPVAAIVGAPGLMHTVVEPWCIGCKLCLPPCPVDCIDLVAPRGEWSAALGKAAQRRAQVMKARRTALARLPQRDRKKIVAAVLTRTAKK